MSHAAHATGKVARASVCCQQSEITRARVRKNNKKPTANNCQIQCSTDHTPHKRRNPKKVLFFKRTRSSLQHTPSLEDEKRRKEIRAGLASFKAALHSLCKFRQIQLTKLIKTRSRCLGWSRIRGASSRTRSSSGNSAASAR